MKPYRDITDPTVAKALAHPLPTRILASLEGRNSEPDLAVVLMLFESASRAPAAVAAPQAGSDGARPKRAAKTAAAE